ncbi:MAG: methyltransferase domain-containing protein [Bacteroidetes bacterium]|jgi:ubiquinone/menaquinone biosynthesis C-methylase UbiE|nr:methyltransferase domain-containing protein [Bacteroidota bacterium]
MKKISIVCIVIVLIITSCSSAKLNFRAYPTLKDEINEYNLTGVDTLVDIGCNWGFMTEFIEYKYPSMYFIVEDLPEFTNYVKNKQMVTQSCVSKTLRFMKKKYEFVAGFVDSIPLPSNFYKRVLCRKTVHEFTNVEKMVSELTRILKSDGELIIAEPEPLPGYEYDKYCKRKHLTAEEIIKIFSHLRLIKSSKIPYKEGNITWQMAVLRFTKN